jgi:hypothetical protein
MHAAATDPRLDVSLRFLSYVVSSAIALALLWFVYLHIGRWLDLERWSEAVPIVELDPLSTQGAPIGTDDVGPPVTAARWDAPWIGPPVRLIAPAFTVFRCEFAGRVTYSDKPCARGGIRVVKLPHS